jgi:hypothetical protein
MAVMIKSLIVYNPRVLEMLDEFDRAKEVLLNLFRRFTDWLAFVF